MNIDLKGNIMTASELIAELQKLPPEAKVLCVYDGAARTPAEVVWLAKNGSILISGHGDVVYYDEDRPTNAPLRRDDPYWKARKN